MSRFCTPNSCDRSFALKFASPGIARINEGASSSSASGSDELSSAEWLAVVPQPASFEFKRNNADSTHFRCVVPWLDTFDAGLQLRFPAVTGLTGGLMFTVPTGPRVGNALSIVADWPSVQPNVRVIKVGTSLQYKKKGATPPPVMPDTTVQLPTAQPPAPARSPQAVLPMPTVGGNTQPPQQQQLPVLSPLQPDPQRSPPRAQVSPPPAEQQEVEPASPVQPVASTTPATRPPDDNETVGGRTPLDVGSEGNVNASAVSTTESESATPQAQQSGINDTTSPALPLAARPLRQPVAESGRGVFTRKRKVSAISRMHAELPSLGGTPDEKGRAGCRKGDKVFAVGFAPSGHRAWFRGEVTGFRLGVPPIIVLYTSTLEGSTLPLALPRPQSAYLLARDVRKLTDEEIDDDSDGDGGDGPDDNDPAAGGGDSGSEGGSDAGDEDEGRGEEDGDSAGSNVTQSVAAEEVNEGSSSEEADEALDDSSSEGADEALDDSSEADVKRRKVGSYCLADVSESLAAEFAAFEQHRIAEHNRHRASASCLIITAENDVGNCLRFLGWLDNQGHLPRGLSSGVQEVLVTVFGDSRVASWAEDFLASLRERGTKPSSQAKYISSLYLMTCYIFEVGRPSTAALHLPVATHVMLKHLRVQCEKMARQQRLYSSSTKGKWLDWPAVQTCRINAICAFNDCSVHLRTKRLRLLTDVVLLCWLVCQPPDRSEPLSLP